MEEPELFLHPHARRVLSDRLDNFASRNNQVIITTHSVDFIRSIDPSINIIHLQKSNEGTVGQNILIRDLRSLLFDPSVSEMFFADKVVLCEGLDAFVFREIVDSMHPGMIDSQNITIINCGGKDNISRFAKLAIMMRLKCFIFCDFDYLLRDKDENLAKNYGVPIHESVSSIKHDFWRQEDVFKDGMNIIKHLDRLRHRIKLEDEGLFYTAKKVEDFNGKYDLEKLLGSIRLEGICILNGEIEDFCLDKSLMSSKNKLSFSTIYNLRNRIILGKRIEEIFDISQINDFINHLLAIS